MIFNKEQIASILPQKPPFLMVDRLLKADKDGIETELLIKKDNLFIEDDRFQEYGMIEHMAQSCAIGLAFINQDAIDPPVNGYLAGISNLKVWNLPFVHSKVKTKVDRFYKLGEMYLLHCSIWQAKQMLMEAKLKLVSVIN